MLTKLCHFQGSFIHSTLSHLISPRFILISSSYLQLYFSRSLFNWEFLLKLCVLPYIHHVCVAYSNHLILVYINIFYARVVTGLLMGHNTLGRHLHLLGLVDIPMCRRCGMEEETSAHIRCECAALASFRHAYLGSFFMEPKGIKIMNLGAICSYGRVTGLPWFDLWHKGPVYKV
jgi:hypothetical protein